MAIERRGKNGIFTIRFTAPNGQRIQKSSGTTDKIAAKELHDRLKAQYWRTTKFKEKPPVLWKEAVTKWIAEKKDKRSLICDIRMLRWLDNFFGKLYLTDITEDVIEQAIKKKREENPSVSNARINRINAVIRAILFTAKNQWKWIDAVPEFRKLPEPDINVRFLTREEEEKLLYELRSLPHLHDMMLFSLSTGLRDQNVCQLSWSQIDIPKKHAWVDAAHSKSKRSLAVPLNSDAMKILERWVGKHPTHVFTYNDQPITRCNNHGWINALKRAGIKNFRWHDLRHTWATRHIQSGTSLLELKDLGGWSTIQMVVKYAHLSSEHLQAAADRISSKPAQNYGANLVHFNKYRNIASMANGLKSVENIGVFEVAGGGIEPPTQGFSVSTLFKKS